MNNNLFHTCTKFKQVCWQFFYLGNTRLNYMITQPNIYKLRAQQKKISNTICAQILSALCTLIFSLMMCSCQTTPISGNHAFLLTTEASENKQGEQAYREILAKEKIEYGSLRSSIIDEVGQRIAQASQKTDYLWEFKTLQNESPNAFCLPGGKVAIYTGIIKYAKNEAGLAAIIGHEVGHAIARHGGQRMSQQLATAMAIEAIQSKTLETMTDKEKQLTMLALGVGATVGLTLPFSRAHETEADEIGLILMARAGYDPREAIDFWDRFGRANKGSIEFLSTHPSSENRRDHLRSILPKALKIYEQSARFGLGRPL